MSLTELYINSIIIDPKIIFVNQPNGKDVAIKIFPLSHREAFEAECIIYETLKLSKNICSIYQIIQEEDYAFIIMKKYDCDLYSFAFEGLSLQLPRVRKIFANICDCIYTLHKNNIAHLDLKPENILVDTATETVVLCDFGHAFIKKPTHTLWRGDYTVNRTCGSRKYSAPASSNVSDPFAADIYSLGVILFVLLTGFFPHKNPESDEIDLEETIQKLSCIPEECKYLLRGMLTADPEDRMDIKQITQHPWISKIIRKKKSLPMSPKLRFWRQ